MCQFKNKEKKSLDTRATYNIGVRSPWSSETRAAITNGGRTYESTPYTLANNATTTHDAPQTAQDEWYGSFLHSVFAGGWNPRTKYEGAEGRYAAGGQ